MTNIDILLEKTFQEHKDTWSEEEKYAVHDHLNEMGIADGITMDDVHDTNLLCMVFIDGYRAGKKSLQV